MAPPKNKKEQLLALLLNLVSQPRALGTAVVHFEGRHATPISSTNSSGLLTSELRLATRVKWLSHDPSVLADRPAHVKIAPSRSSPRPPPTLFRLARQCYCILHGHDRLSGNGHWGRKCQTEKRKHCTKCKAKFHDCGKLKEFGKELSPLGTVSNLWRTICDVWLLAHHAQKGWQKEQFGCQQTNRYVLYDQGTVCMALTTICL